MGNIIGIIKQEEKLNDSVIALNNGERILGIMTKNHQLGRYNGKNIETTSINELNKVELELKNDDSISEVVELIADE